MNKHSGRHEANSPATASPPGGDAIVVDHLQVQRGKRPVLADLSVRIPTGQVIGLLGPSGGGKSTLMRAIVGVQVVKGGTVTVLGEPAGAPALRHRLGYLTQAPSLYEDLSVRENVAYFGRVLGVGADSVDRAIEEVDLTEVLLSALDLDRVLQSVDLQAVVSRLDLDAVVAGVDLQRVIDLVLDHAGIDRSTTVIALATQIRHRVLPLARASVAD